MLILLSQDGLKAIDASRIDFYYILPERNVRRKFVLQAKSPKSPAENGYYDFLNLFEHEDVEVVKAAMKILITAQMTCTRDFIMIIDLPNLYKVGMKVAPELAEAYFKQGKDSAE